MIGVKGLTRDIPLARHGLLVRDIVDLRVSRHVQLTLIVLQQFAKDLGGGDELWRRKLLAADHQHVMLNKGAVQRGAGFVVNNSIQINPAHLGAGPRGQPGDRVLHQAASSTTVGRRNASMATGTLVWQSLAAGGTRRSPDRRSRGEPV